MFYFIEKYLYEDVNFLGKIYGLGFHKNYSSNKEDQP